MDLLVYSTDVRPRRYIQLVDYCRSFSDAHGSPPSYSQIRRALRISHDGTVRRYVKQAEAAGLLTLGDSRGGRGQHQQRIRLGTPSEADPQRIKMGRDL